MSSRGQIAFFVPHEGCPQTCSFCNQKTISGTEKAPTPDDVSRTLQSALENLGEKARQYEIAFFGGSFTAVGKELQHSLLQAATPFCGADMFSGIRFSTRPDAISEKVLQDLKKYPITQIELGVQSMNAEVLCVNQRGHTPEDTRKATKLIQSFGYSLTLQMMTGLYKQSIEDTLETARELAALRPESVRIYPTLVLEGTALARWYRQGRYLPPSLEDTLSLCGQLLRLFEENGIPVLRLGLHDQQGLKESVIAGPYHPALRELCIGHALLSSVVEQRKRQNCTSKSCIIWVAPQYLSCLTGHERQALRPLERQGVQVTVRTDPTIKKMIARVEPKAVT